MQLPARPEGDPDELRAAARRLRALADGIEFKIKQPRMRWSDAALGLGKFEKAVLKRLNSAESATKPLPPLLRAVAVQLDVAALQVEERLAQWRATCRQIRERGA